MTLGDEAEGGPKRRATLALRCQVCAIPPPYKPGDCFNCSWHLENKFPEIGSAKASLSSLSLSQDCTWNILMLFSPPPYKYVPIQSSKRNTHLFNAFFLLHFADGRWRERERAFGLANSCSWLRFLSINDRLLHIDWSHVSLRRLKTTTTTATWLTQLYTLKLLIATCIFKLYNFRVCFAHRSFINSSLAKEIASGMKLCTQSFDRLSTTQAGPSQYFASFTSRLRV